MPKFEINGIFIFVLTQLKNSYTAITCRIRMFSVLTAERKLDNNL